MYECNINQCSHNKNGKCLGECEKPCTNYPVVEYIATDQLLHSNRCERFRKNNQCNLCDVYTLFKKNCEL